LIISMKNTENDNVQGYRAGSPVPGTQRPSDDSGNVPGYRPGPEDNESPDYSGDVDDPTLGTSSGDGPKVILGLCAHHKDVEPKDISRVLKEVDELNDARRPRDPNVLLKLAGRLVSDDIVD